LQAADDKYRETTFAGKGIKCVGNARKPKIKFLYFAVKPAEIIIRYIIPTCK
jgi:hypothetical protein